MDFEFAELGKDLDPEGVHPLVLAYLGDAVYELYIRTRLVTCGIARVKRLHCQSVKYVKASAQAEFIRSIAEKLTEDELAIMKKGRNTKSNVPRSADVSDYRYSTGLESLLGYLYLKNNKKRLMEILEMLDWEEDT
ncbi:MAG: ribonuclease III domain-containing protein [Bacillota bacterium]